MFSCTLIPFTKDLIVHPSEGKYILQLAAQVTYLFLFFYFYLFCIYEYTCVFVYLFWILLIVYFLL